MVKHPWDTMTLHQDTETQVALQPCLQPNAILTAKIKLGKIEMVSPGSAFSVRTQCQINQASILG